MAPHQKNLIHEGNRSHVTSKDNESSCQKAALKDDQEEKDLSDSEEFRLFFEGYSVPGDSGADARIKPKWINDKLLERGQNVGREFMGGILLSDVILLQFLFSFPYGKDPLIATGNSSTVESARIRYISTSYRVMQWYKGDLWGDSKAAREIATVRSAHARIRRSMKIMTKEEFEKALEFRPYKADVARPVWPILQKMFKERGRNLIIPPEYADKDKREFLNQTEMVATHFAFFGLALESPRNLGMSDLSNEDLEGLVHFWAAVGYLLGIEDRFNKCIGGLESARKTWKLLLKHLYLPGLGHVGPEWEHMNRCVFDGITDVMYLMPSQEDAACLLLELTGHSREAQQVSRLLTWSDYALRAYRFILFNVIMRFSIARRLISQYLYYKVTNLFKLHVQGHSYHKEILFPDS